VNRFLWPVRVYYEDTDSGGVVYYANYLKYLERARTELLRSYGFEQDQLIEQEGIIFAVRALQIEYRKPARFNEMLQVSVNVTKVGNASFTCEQVITRDADETVLCQAQVKLACLNAENFQPQAIPKFLIREITRAD
jgi:acyl-CoA thioester hydrolase